VGVILLGAFRLRMAVMDPQFNSVDSNSLESVGGRKKMRKKISVGETRKRFMTVKVPGKKKITVKK
jgi:hypothetical protein